MLPPGELSALLSESLTCVVHIINTSICNREWPPPTHHTQTLEQGECTHMYTYVSPCVSACICEYVCNNMPQKQSRFSTRVLWSGCVLLFLFPFKWHAISELNTPHNNRHRAVSSGSVSSLSFVSFSKCTNALQLNAHHIDCKDDVIVTSSSARSQRYHPTTRFTHSNNKRDIVHIKYMMRKIAPQNPHLRNAFRTKRIILLSIRFSNT